MHDTVLPMNFPQYELFRLSFILLLSLRVRYSVDTTKLIMIFAQARSFHIDVAA